MAKMQNMMKMMKQVKQVRKMQKELARKTVEITSTDKTVTVVARGDMTVKSITIVPEAISPEKLTRLQKTLVSTVNGALDSSKKAAAKDMQKMTGGMGLGDMLGG